MGVVVITPPTAAMVNLDEAKAHLRVDDNNSDAIITSLVAAATDFVERETRQVFLSRTLNLMMDQFPNRRRAGGHERMIVLPCPPLQSVSQIAYVDSSGNVQTFPTSAYTVDSASKPGRIVLNSGWEWPETTSNANAVSITFVAGYGSASANVPDLVKAAVKLLVGAWFENREAVTGKVMTPVPMAVEAILNQFKFPEVG